MFSALLWITSIVSCCCSTAKLICRQLRQTSPRREELAHVVEELCEFCESLFDLLDICMAFLNLTVCRSRLSQSVRVQQLDACRKVNATEANDMTHLLREDLCVIAFRRGLNFLGRRIGLDCTFHSFSSVLRTHRGLTNLHLALYALPIFLPVFPLHLLVALYRFDELRLDEVNLLSESRCQQLHIDRAAFSPRSRTCCARACASAPVRRWACSVLMRRLSSLLRPLVSSMSSSSWPAERF